MIKFLTACTRTPDDPEGAVRDIVEQLDLEHGLLKHSAGLLFCHMAFADLGVVEALAKRLPFGIAGCSSQCFAMRGVEDEIMLSLTVLTSDDTEFALGVSEPLGEDLEGQVRALYQKTAAALPEKPGLVFAFQPNQVGFNGEALFTALDRSCGGAPIFGTCALNVNLDERNPRVFYGGQAYADRLALVLLAGPVKPKFFSALFPEKALFAQNAVITGAQDNLILSINHTPAVAYLKKVGIVHDDIYDTLFVIPLLIDYGNGIEPEIVIMTALDENGAVMCSRTIQAGGTLNIGSTTADYVLKTADALLKTIGKEESLQGAPPESRCLFIFSCFSRVVVLGDPMAEIGVVQRNLAGFPGPYAFLYSAGELCPQYNTGTGETVNRLHYYAIVACLL